MNVRFWGNSGAQYRLDKGSGIFGRYLFGHLARLIVGERRLLNTARESNAH
jgi:hypothetical protein